MGEDATAVLTPLRSGRPENHSAFTQDWTTLSSRNVNVLLCVRSSQKNHQKASPPKPSPCFNRAAFFWLEKTHGFIESLVLGHTGHTGRSDRSDRDRAGFSPVPPCYVPVLGHIHVAVGYCCQWVAVGCHVPGQAQERKNTSPDTVLLRIKTNGEENLHCQAAGSVLARSSLAT